VKRFKFEIIVGLSIGLLVGIILLFSDSPEYAISIGLAFGVIISLILILSELHGRLQHRKKLRGRVMRPLRNERGFEVEHINKYWRYEGILDQYYFKVFYNWASDLGGNISRDLGIVLYFQTPTSSDDPEGIKRLEGIMDEMTYDGRYFSAKQKLRFGLSNLELHFVYNWFSRHKTLLTKMRELVAIARRENLEPISRAEVQRLINKNPIAHGPWIETYFQE